MSSATAGERVSYITAMRAIMGIGVKGGSRGSAFRARRIPGVSVGKPSLIRVMEGLPVIHELIWDVDTSSKGTTQTALRFC